MVIIKTKRRKGSKMLKLEHEKIKLRALTKEDAKISWAWRNNENIRYYFSGHPFLVNPEKEEAWLAKVLCSDMPITTFGIEELENNSLVGMSFIKDINLLNRTAEFAIFIGDENAAGKGYAKEATLKTIDFAFNDLNLHRLSLKVQEENISAVKLYEKCAFKKEGLIRECVYKNGHYLNLILMSILKSEYLDIAYML